MPSGVHAAVPWCGTDEVAADRVPNLEVSSPRQIRVVYAFPAGAADNFAALAPGIAGDVAAIDGWWQSQDPTRAPRWDRYPFPGCTTRIGALDLAAVRLPRDAAYYAGDDGARLERDVAAALDPSADEKTLVYFDGAARDPRVCGRSRVAEEAGGRFGIAAVFLRSDCGLQPGDGGRAALTAAHELIHDLGAMPDRGPPHACPPESGHPCDSTADILYPYLTSGATLGATLLDVGRDDYYGHNGDWWDVQDSSWLIHLPQFPLQISLEGAGRLTTSVSADCAAGCTLALDDGFEAQIDATPSPGWTFAGWRGNCTGTAPCAATMDRARSVTAVFVRRPQVVRVAISGRGRVTSSPAGLSCPGRCAHAFAAGSLVRLAARPAAGRRFLGWSGACNGRGACVLRADRLRAVGATFR